MKREMREKRGKRREDTENMEKTQTIFVIRTPTADWPKSISVVSNSTSGGLTTVCTFRNNMESSKAVPFVVVIACSFLFTRMGMFHSPKIPQSPASRSALTSKEGEGEE